MTEAAVEAPQLADDAPTSTEPAVGSVLTDDVAAANTETPEAETAATAVDGYTEFTAPEGTTLNADTLTAATPLFKELGLSQEQAQKLVDFQTGQMESSANQQADSYSQTMQEWREQSQNDKEFGGAKFDESVATAKQALDKFGTPELKQLLSEHGVGNHPEIIRMLVKVGGLTKEDVPGGPTTPTQKAKDRVSLLYN